MTKIAFKRPTAVAAVNELNRQFQRAGKAHCTNRAFLVDAHTAEIDTPAGFEVDVVNAVLDAHNGVYADKWFDAALCAAGPTHCEGDSCAHEHRRTSSDVPLYPTVDAYSDG